MKSLASAVHVTALVDPGADLAEDVSIGPYAIVGPGVTIGSGTRVAAHAVIERDTTIGERCEIHYGAIIGGDPQDLKYAGEPSQLVVGDRTIVREFVTLNRGTAARGRPEIGRDFLLLA